MTEAALRAPQASGGPSRTARLSLSWPCADAVLRARARQAEGCSGKGGEPVLTVRALVGGLLVGSLLCCSNTFFGLQTGWVTMGSLQVRSFSLSCAAGGTACV
jgi:hypothetical protein